MRASVAACVLLIGVVRPAGGEDLAIPVSNPSFEKVGADGRVVGWSIESSGGCEVRADTSAVHQGVGSLAVACASPGSVTMTSEPLALEVGRLYRLSGWIRTEGLLSDPTSRYPTAVPSCLSMATFPFTNHSPAVGSTRGWTRVETLFVATASEDRLRAHVGMNGSATGAAWFDDLGVERVHDISAWIPPETVHWFGPGFRYDDRGWIFVHIEGEPYQRGYQYGVLLADEIVAYMAKLGILENEADPEAGWKTVRFATDALFLRSYEHEYLEEMRGIADGAAHAGAEYDGRALDLLDIVAVNSVVDLGQLRRGLRVTPHSLTGQSFLAAEDELLVDVEEHKCSAFAATGPATAGGGVVFGQIFMWGGYTGVHWDVICDVVPSEGHRLVYQTFPGGIHSGADFYINSAGIVIGETTVSQTPFEPGGTPQANRIRKAAQYASSIDEVVDILWRGNNGMYTNDWPMANVTTGEVAILLLGTHRKRLWRTGEDIAPFGTPGFLWANNNNRDPEVRREYVAQPDDAPFDLVFSPWNRDVAFNRFYQEHRGRIDAIAGVNLWASSPINRAHACDGKITTTEMARELAFLAHYGKLTLREKFPGESGRNMADLPGARPHLSLGYSVPSPVLVAEALPGAREPAPEETEAATLDLAEVEPFFTIEARQLWRSTVFPASEADGWFVSGTAAYWNILHELEEEPDEAAVSLGRAMAGLNARYLYTVSREHDLAPVTARRAYDRHAPYVVPRVKGACALHQLRLLLGTDRFLEVMRAIHERFAGRETTTAEIVAAAEEVAGRPLAAFIGQWIEREGLPEPAVSVDVVANKRDGWRVQLEVEQAGEAYHFVTFVEVEAGGRRHLRRVEVDGEHTSVGFAFAERPERVVFNPLHDIPVVMDRFYTWANFIDDFHNTRIVYGTSRQIEANHTLARRWQRTVADRYVEILPPLVKDAEISDAKLAEHDLMILGHPTDNSLVERLADELPVTFARNLFRWHGATFADPDDGLFLILPNPRNSDRVLYLIVANSALQLHDMTRTYSRDIPSWAVFKGEEIVEEGYHPVERFVIRVPDADSGRGSRRPGRG